MKKSELRQIIREEIQLIKEGSGFPDMTKWWKEDPKDVMSFVYFLQKQVPPSNQKKWDEAWKSISAQLNKKHPAPKGWDKKNEIKEELDDRNRVLYDKTYNQTRIEIIKYIKILKSILGRKHPLYVESLKLLFKIDKLDEGFETSVKN